MESDITHTVLKISEFSCSPDELSSKLGLIPTKTGTKGQIYFIGPEKNKIQKVWDYNYWEYRIEKSDNTWISDQLDEFIKVVIIPIKDTLKGLSSECEIEISLIQYSHISVNPGLHFDKTIIKTISEIDADLDIDIYCLCED